MAIPFPKNELPYTSRYAQVDGYKMHYLDEGSGPVVVMVHGNPTWCFFFRNLVEKLKETHRVIVPDQLGCGLSERPVGRKFRARDRIEHLKSLVDSLGLQKFSIIMHDWGGPIGTGMALDYKERIEKIVYFNTTLTEIESLPPIIKKASTPGIGTVLTKYTKRFLRFMLDLGAAKKVPKNVQRGYLYPYQTIKDRSAIWEFVEDIPFKEDHPTYPELLTMAKRLPEFADKPVKIIWGLKDPCFHPNMLSKVSRHFPQAQVVELQNASHLLLEDEPEVVSKEVLTFLNNSSVSNEKDKNTGASKMKAHTFFDKFNTWALAHPQQDAAIIPNFSGAGKVSYQKYTYSQLREIVCSYNRGFTKLGLKSGDRVLFLVAPGLEFLALTYGVMSVGAIPIFIDPGISREYLFECLQDIESDAFVGSPKAHLLRLANKSAFAKAKFCVIAGGMKLPKTVTSKFLRRHDTNHLEIGACDDTAFVAFTSGATGKPKGVVFTQEMVEAQLAIFKEQVGLDGGELDMPLLPIFSLFNLALGIGSAFPPVDPSKPLELDPAKISQMVSDLGISYSFGSPTLWKKIGEYALRHKQGMPSLKRLLLAGAPVPKATVELLHSSIDNASVFTPYGATESLPVTLVSGQQIIEQQLAESVDGEQGTFVGKSVDGVTVRIIEPVDGVIDDISKVKDSAALTVGEVIVQGQNVSKSYFRRADADAVGKIKDGASNWHRMGDMGYLDQAGNLYFCGRKAHRVHLSDRMMYSVPVEYVFNQHENVNRSALVELGNDQAGIVIEAIASLSPLTENAKKGLVKELQELSAVSPHASKITKVFFHPSFPVDRRHNAKIFRDQLSTWAKEHMEGSIALS